MPPTDPSSAEILYGSLAAISMLLTLCVSGLTIYKLTRRQPKIEEYVDTAVGASERRTNHKIDELKADIAASLKSLSDQGEDRVVRIYNKIDDNAKDTQRQIHSLTSSFGTELRTIAKELGTLSGHIHNPKQD